MSSPSHRLIFAAEADDDITDILYHRRARWGDDQEQRYAEVPGRTFALLANNPRIGRARNDLRPGYRAYPVGQHPIIYRIDDAVAPATVIALRVVHARRDLRLAIGDEP